MRERDQRRKYKQYLRLKKVLESIRKDKEKCAEREETLNGVLESLKDPCHENFHPLDFLCSPN